MNNEIIKLAFQHVKNGQAKELKQLITENESLMHHKFVGGANWLHKAAMYDAISVIELLVKSGIPIDSQNDEGDTALVFALGQGNVNAAKWLLDNGANVEHGSGWRATPIISAIYSGNLDLVELIINRGAKINQSFGKQGQSPLDYAIMQGNQDIVDYLISRGAAKAENKENKYSSRIVDHLKDGYDELYLLNFKNVVNNLKIFVAPPSETRNYHTLVTVGMSDRPMDVPKGKEEYRYAELMINLRGDWPLSAKDLSKSENNWPVEWLLKLANYPFDSEIPLASRFLVIDNGEPPEPVSPTVKYSCFLLALPDTDFYRPALKNGEIVNFYTVFPMYTEESYYEKKEGVESLLMRFKEFAISNIVEKDRRNVG